METKIYDFEDRLVQFAGKAILFCKSLPKDAVGHYYLNQILRSSGSAALHYGEAQGTTTIPDFIHKTTNVLKELRETKVSLRILDFAAYGNKDLRLFLINEAKELSSISARMILNKKQLDKDQNESK